MKIFSRFSGNLKGIFRGQVLDHLGRTWILDDLNNAKTTTAIIHNTTQPGKEKEHVCEEHAASRRLILNAKLKEQVAGYSCWEWTGYPPMMYFEVTRRLVMLIKPPTCPKIQLRKYHMIIRYQPMVTWWFMLVVSLLSQESVAKGGLLSLDSLIRNLQLFLWGLLDRLW